MEYKHQCTISAHNRAYRLSARKVGIDQDVMEFLTRLDALDPGVLQDATSPTPPPITAPIIPPDLVVSDLIPSSEEQDYEQIKVMGLCVGVGGVVGCVVGGVVGVCTWCDQVVHGVKWCVSLITGHSVGGEGQETAATSTGRFTPVKWCSPWCTKP